MLKENQGVYFNIRLAPPMFNTIKITEMMKEEICRLKEYYLNVFNIDVKEKKEYSNTF